MPHVKSLAIFFGEREIGRVSLSGHGTFLSRRSCAAAKTEVPTQSGLLLPYERLFIHPLPTGNEIQPTAGRNPALGRSKSSLRSVEICGRSPQTMKPRNLFGFGASFTLAAIYSRGTCRPTTIDVLMFHFRVRNGTGWDHQAMTTRFQGASLCSARCLPR